MEKTNDKAEGKTKAKADSKSEAKQTEAKVETKVEIDAEASTRAIEAELAPAAPVEATPPVNPRRVAEAKLEQQLDEIAEERQRLSRVRAEAEAQLYHLDKHEANIRAEHAKAWPPESTIERARAAQEQTARERAARVRAAQQQQTAAAHLAPLDRALAQRPRQLPQMPRPSRFGGRR